MKTATPAAKGRGLAAREATNRRVAGARVAFVVLDLLSSNPLPAYDYLLRGVSRAAERHRMELDVLFLSEANEVVDRLSGSTFDGLILHGSFLSAEQSQPLHRIPTVWLMGNRRRPVWGDQVMPDNATIGQIAAQYLLQRAHRHVMYLGLRNNWSIDVRMLAFQQAIQDAGGTVTTIAHSLRDGEHEQPGDTVTAANELLKTYREIPEKPTGLFLAEDALIRPTHHAMAMAGMQVGAGGDLELISCNNDPSHLVGVRPMPATIDIRYEMIGYRGVEQLVARLMHDPLPERLRLMLEPTLVPPPSRPT